MARLTQLFQSFWQIEMMFQKFEFLVDGICLPAVAILGVFANGVFIFIFTFRRRDIHTFQRCVWYFIINLYLILSLMICLSYFDILYLFSSIVLFTLPVLWPSIASTFIFVKATTFILPLAHIICSEDLWISSLRINTNDDVFDPGEIHHCVSSFL